VKDIAAARTNAMPLAMPLAMPTKRRPHPAVIVSRTAPVASPLSPL
jgi:hypothetical protein